MARRRSLGILDPIPSAASSAGERAQSGADLKPLPASAAPPLPEWYQNPIVP